MAKRYVDLDEVVNVLGNLENTCAMPIARDGKWLRERLIDICGFSKITPNEYQSLAARTINKNLNTFDMEHHSVHGMVGEVGEINSIYQKYYQGHDIDQNHLKKELGDLMWFVAEYCTAMGWNLEDVMELNINKLRARYPEGFDAERSLHREENDI